MVLNRYRRQASKISQDTKLNRIARTTPLTSPQPTDSLTSSAQQLGYALTSLFEHGQRIAQVYRVDTEAVWTEMLERSRGNRK
jgi:hypothetical protein